jgi:hypothetical protein
MLTPDAVVDQHVVTLVGFAGGGSAPALVDGISGGISGGGGVGMHVVVRPRSVWALDIGGREGFWVNDARTLGCVLVGARLDPAGALFFRGGFAHHHEMPFALARQVPVETALGSAVGIRHRSGLDLAVGVDGSLATLLPEKLAGLGVVAELSTAVFPDDHGPRAYVFVDVGLSLDLGKRPPRAP